MAKYSSYVLYLLISILVLILYANDFAPTNSVQRSLDDFLCLITAPEGKRPNVAMVVVDQRAQDSLGPWPWDYDLIADLAAATASGNPRSIVFDFYLPENVSQDSAGFTDILAGQLSWIDNAVLPYDIALASYRSSKTSNPSFLFNNAISTDNPLGVLNEKSALSVRRVFPPAEKLLAHKPYLGFNYFLPDNDRVLRRHPMVMNYEGYYYPSQSLLAAALFLGLKPDQVKVEENKAIDMGGRMSVPIDDASRYFMRFSGGSPFISYSAADVLGENFDFNRLRDKVVLMGVDDPRYTESFRTPAKETTPSLWVKATVIENIINHNIVSPGKNRALIEMLILFVLGGICAYVLPRVSLLFRFIILGGCMFVLANVSYFMLSSLGVIPKTVYVGLELILFMIAAPLLDMSLITGVSKDKASAKAGLPKATLPKAAKAQTEAPVHEIKDTGPDQADIHTRAIDREDQVPANETIVDHQAIDPDRAADVADRTMATETSDQDAEPAIDATPVVPDDEQTGFPPSEDSAGVQKQPEAKPDSQPVAMPTGPGEIKNLGRYQVTDVLGKGAMGLVYRGIDPAINRPVALKTIRLDFVNDPEEMAELKERLFREAQAAGKLSHPNIVTIYDVGSEGHLQYIAMEYLEGQTLEDMIKRKTKFNYRIIAQIIGQICNALDYAHEKGIVHRDIKPANIMILKDYGAKVMDYGIARIDSNSMTKTGIAMGTPNYISPEQLKGMTIDRRADIFSLGVVMYEMLLGRRPFKGENITSLVYAIMHTEPEKPSNINPQVPLLFDHIVIKALKKEPAERYQKASEINSDLHDFVESFARA